MALDYAEAGEGPGREEGLREAMKIVSPFIILMLLTVIPAVAGTTGLVRSQR